MPRLKGMTGAGDRVGRASRRAPRALYEWALRDRTQAAVYAYESGLVRPSGY